jgi:hypothetical protein
MTDPELDLWEQELQRLRPAPLPQTLEARVRATISPDLHDSPPPAASHNFAPRCSWLITWVLPAAAAVAFAVFCWIRFIPAHRPITNTASAASAFSADRVEIDRQLIGSFEGLAELPGGKPLRFRCYDWMDHIRVRDSARGIVFEKDEPYREIVPVRYDHY